MHLVLGFILLSTIIFSFFDISLVFYSVIRINFRKPGDWFDARSRNGIQLNWGREANLTFTQLLICSQGESKEWEAGAGWDSQHMQRDWWMRMHILCLVTYLYNTIFHFNFPSRRTRVLQLRIRGWWSSCVRHLSICKHNKRNASMLYIESF